LIFFKKIDVVFVESPLQALSAIEAVHHFKLNPVLLFVRYLPESRSQINNKHMDTVLETNVFSRVIKIQDRQFRIINKLQTFGLYLYFLINRSNIRNLVIGEWRSEWMQRCVGILRKDTVILCDDGTIVVDILKNKLEKNIRWHEVNTNEKSRIKFFFKYLIHKKLSLRERQYSKFHLFSTFFSECDSEKVRITHNPWSFLRERLISKQKEGIYYFGSKYSEAGYFDQSVELQFLGSVFKYLCKKYPLEKIQYVPHRDDSISKVERIKEIGFNIIYLDQPAELYFIKSKTYPKSVNGAFTSAVMNLKWIYEPDEINVFSFPFNKVASDKREDVVMLYDFYTQHNFNVIDII